ncbi:MAG: class I SAM-dependent methyltransferase [Halioglobus sp.]
MEDLVASITAMSVSRMRAIHARSDPQPVLHDSWGDRLVPASLLVAAIANRESPVSSNADAASEEELARISDDFMRASPAYTNVILRARYTEDALRTAIARGVRQYVVIGAGFDSYALRIPPEAGALTVIEIDHPATQSLKRQRISECGIVLGDNVQFVAADLATESLDAALSRSAFRPDEPAFFAWLGVTMYLTREANLTTLGKIAQCSVEGSELVFSYIDQKMFEPSGAGEAASFSDLESTVKSFGEPFISGFHPALLAQELSEIGLELQEDLSEFQMAERYDPQGVNGFMPLDRSHVARVRVGGMSKR